nr:hypothetical protein Y39A1B.4 - Caenorhabditis elegans [Caenorhabditis elegans]
MRIGKIDSKSSIISFLVPEL